MDQNSTSSSAIKSNLPLILRWVARVGSLLSLGVMLLFIVGEGFNPAHLKARELMLFTFFPIGVMLGLALGWWQERLGGGLVVFSLAAFYLVNLAQAGRFPSGAAFAILAAPGVLYLWSAVANRPQRAA